MTDIPVDPANILPRVGQTRFLLKLPHTSPTTDREHQANLLHLEDIINNLPLSTAVQTGITGLTRNGSLNASGITDPAPDPIVLDDRALPGPGNVTLTMTGYGTSDLAILTLNGNNYLIPLLSGGSTSSGSVALACTGPGMTITFSIDCGSGAPTAGWNLEYDYPTYIQPSPP